jgi:hypothetical protein
MPRASKEIEEFVPAKLKRGRPRKVTKAELLGLPEPTEKLPRGRPVKAVDPEVLPPAPKKQPHRWGPGNYMGQDRTMPAEVRKALTDMSPQAIVQLRRMLMDPDTPAKLRLDVINSVLDRAYGKPTQEVEHSGGVGVAVIEFKGQLDEWSK